MEGAVRSSDLIWRAGSLPVKGFRPQLAHTLPLLVRPFPNGSSWDSLVLRNANPLVAMKLTNTLIQGPQGLWIFNDQGN